MSDGFKLFPMCVSHELRDLSNTPHRSIGVTDLAIVAGYKGKIVSSLAVNGEPVTNEDILAAAENGKPKFQLDSLASLLGLPGIKEGGAIDAGMYVLGTSNASFGAAVLGYPKELKKAAKLLGEGFYILPSSVHEVILLPDSKAAGMKPEELQQVVAEINKTEVREQERLSNSVYHFDGENLITVAGPAAEIDFSEGGAGEDASGEDGESDGE